MKKKLLTLIVALAVGHSLYAQNVNIPDANFKAYLLGDNSINTNSDSEISVAEATAYTGGINCVAQGVADATGIEAFPNVNIINFSNNQLTSIDLSANTQIINLALGGNQLTTLDVSNNSSLTAIYCDNNQLTSMNVANGNNTAIGDWAFYTNGNPNLSCVDVDNAAWSTANWTSHVDATTSFSENCLLSCVVNIPDANFKAYLLANTAINTNSDAEIQCAEAAAYNSYIDCSYLSISDLTGIEAFTALTTLNCGGNSLTSLDLSANTALTFLGCEENDLTTLDVSSNTALLDLNCHTNSLTSLTLGNLANLQVLQCSYNSLTALDISGCSGLLEFYCGNNQITSLDGSNNSSVGEFYCNANALTSLNVANGNNANIDLYATNNPDLLCVEVDDAAWSTANMASAIDGTAGYSEDCSSFCVVDIPDANFKAYLLGNTSINTNGNGHIECSEAAAYSGAIAPTSMSVSDLTGIEAFTAITNLNCADNNLTSLDLSANTALAYLYCQANALTTLDLSSNTALVEVICHSNDLTSLTVGNLPNLEVLSCGGNDLTALDVSGCPALLNLHCDGNQITGLDLSNATLLFNLSVANNALTALDLSSNINLQFLNCWNNQLTALDVSTIATLESVYCMHNSIVTLDFINNPALVDIQASYNSLTSANVANGNNTIITGFNLLDNPDLTCIKVDDAAYSTANWTNIDATASFSEDCTPCIVNIPDANFKNFLLSITAIDANNDNEVQCTEAENFAGYLHCENLGIADLTGVEAFVNVWRLRCFGNQLTSVDLSQNTALTELQIQNNQLTSLDVSNCTALENLYLQGNPITDFDASANTALVDFRINDTPTLQTLDIANGNNTTIAIFRAQNCPNLTCVKVDDYVYSATNWTFIPSSGVYTETNCLTVGVDAQEEVDFNLYPNPATDVLNLQTDASISHISISDMAGRTVMAQSLNGATNARLDVSSMESGVYLLTVTDINGITTSNRWIKK